MPVPKPTPGTAGPPIDSTRSSYLPPPPTPDCAPRLTGRELEGGASVVVHAAHQGVVGCVDDTLYVRHSSTRAWCVAQASHRCSLSLGASVSTAGTTPPCSRRPAAG